MPIFDFLGFAAVMLFLLVMFTALVAGANRPACKPRPGKIAKKRVGIVSYLFAVAFPPARDWRAGPLAGLHFVKEAPTDVEAALRKTLDSLTADLSGIADEMKKAKEATEKQFKDLTTHFSGVKGDNDEVKKSVEQHTKDYADLVAKTNSLVASFDALKKEIDAPIFRGGSDLAEADHKAAIELQKARFMYNGGSEVDFKVDETKLVKTADYRSALYKLMGVGPKTKDEVIRSFTDAETKAFEASGLDTAFFVPQVLGIEVDCNILCSQITDLYSPVNVTRSTFMFPVVKSYADIGSYTCDAACDAELGEAGNITWVNGHTYDWRGAFCLQKKTIQEANYDLLGFMMRSIVRSYGINRNRALITGDGKNEPLGWLKADLFPKIKTAAGKFDHVAFRRFMSSCPVEYGAVVATMHQNVFAYLASATDGEGRFIFGDGLMTFSPDDVRERLRISNCLPDPTEGGVKGDTANPFVAGSFVAAAGNWSTAYASVSKRPIFVEQYVGGSSAWCTKYQFGAEDGGFIQCAPAARTLVIG